MLRRAWGTVEDWSYTMRRCLTSDAEAAGQKTAYKSIRLIILLTVDSPVVGTPPFNCAANSAKLRNGCNSSGETEVVQTINSRHQTLCCVVLGSNGSRSTVSGDGSCQGEYLVGRAFRKIPKTNQKKGRRRNRLEK